MEQNQNMMNLVVNLIWLNFNSNRPPIILWVVFLFIDYINFIENKNKKGDRNMSVALSEIIKDVLSKIPTLETRINNLSTKISNISSSGGG